MSAIKLRALTEGIEGAVISGDPEINIEAIEYDSRLMRPGGLFFAVTGFKRDGYDFVARAKEKGAVAVMGEREFCDHIGTHVHVPDIRQAMADASARFYDYPGEKIKVCGVTGTNGKTTTCHLIRTILEMRNKKTGLICSTVYDTGGDRFHAERTTPEALDLQRLFLLMKNNYCVNAVMEVSSHALVLKRVEHINFRVAVFTNITRDHLDFHESMDAYLAAKGLLLEKLSAPLSYAVINLDVPEFRRFFGELNSEYMSYSLSDETADVHCARYDIKPEGTVMDLVTPMGTETIKFPLPGRFNLLNAVAAAAAGRASGGDLDNVVAGLEAARPVPGRFNRLDAGQPFSVFVDFAHTPDALTRLCESARELSDGRILIMFGCGGDRDRGKRPLMGTAATEGADYAVITSDNPRSEDPLAIIEDIKPGLRGENYTVEPDRRKAIELILKQAEPGDVVLLAGKGAETYQEIGDERQTFDEIAEAARVLSSMGYTTTDITARK